MKKIIFKNASNQLFNATTNNDYNIIINDTKISGIPVMLDGNC